MKRFNRLVALATVMTMASLSSQSLEADEYASNLGGYGYAESRQSGYFAPAIALGSIALVAIIAVALQDSHGHGGHGHAH